MAAPDSSVHVPLRENILFLVAGTFIGSLSILLFDNRLYTTGDVILLFGTVLASTTVQAVTASRHQFLAVLGAAWVYVQSAFISLLFLTALYASLLPFAFDVLLTLKWTLLLMFIQTSFTFFSKYKKQYRLTQDKESVIGQSVKQQQVKELEVLKQQIDPHFIFNSFNTLAFLIDENSEKAKQFTNKLANVYRYIIFNSGKNLVSVADEVGFARDYAYLQEMRYSNEVQVNFYNFTEADNVFILPVSIQILIENSIKHNAFNRDEPLRIQVCYENGSVSVENNLSVKNVYAPSSKIGLANLRDRCRLIFGKDLIIEKKESRFKVFLPVLLT